jgi:hypothetical protein
MNFHRLLQTTEIHPHSENQAIANELSTEFVSLPTLCVHLIGTDLTFQRAVHAMDSHPSNNRDRRPQNIDGDWRQDARSSGCLGLSRKLGQAN